MCWWHMATHWQLGVQVQEQTWVLKSQLAEAKFSACALGASMPGKHSANITPPCSTAFRPRVDAACQGTTAAIQIDSEEQRKRNKKMKTPTSQSQLQPRKVFKTAQLLIWGCVCVWERLFSQRLRGFHTTLCLQEHSLCSCDRTSIRAWRSGTGYYLLPSP